MEKVKIKGKIGDKEINEEITIRELNWSEKNRAEAKGLTSAKGKEEYEMILAAKEECIFASIVQEDSCPFKTINDLRKLTPANQGEKIARAYNMANEVTPKEGE